MKDCSRCRKTLDGSHSHYCRSCYNAYKRDWYQRNREKEVARCSAYNKAKPEVAAASMRRCRARRPEFYREYSQAYRAANPDLVKLWDSNKRGTRRAAKTSSLGLTRAEWKEFRSTRKAGCYWCGAKSKELQIDHYIALSRGGKHSRDNLVWACARCNNSKNAKSPFDFARERGRLL